MKSLKFNLLKPAETLFQCLAIYYRSNCGSIHSKFKKWLKVRFLKNKRRQFTGVTEWVLRFNSAQNKGKLWKYLINFSAKKLSVFFFLDATTSCIDFLVCFQAITKELFDEALRALADEDYLTVTGKTVRLLAWRHTLQLCTVLNFKNPYPVSTSLLTL